MNTSHGHHIEGTEPENILWVSKARCGGPACCSKCSREAAQAINPSTDTGENPQRFTSKQKIQFPLINMKDLASWEREILIGDPSINYQTMVIEMVQTYIDNQYINADRDIPAYQVLVTWYAKNLNTPKAMVTTTLPDGMYYEVTINVAKREAYIDAYIKFENTVVKF